MFRFSISIIILWARLILDQFGLERTISQPGEGLMKKFYNFSRFFVFGLIILTMIMSACETPTTEEEKAVISAVETFFHALATKDSAEAKTVMMPQGRFYSVREDGTIRTQTHETFFKSIAAEKSDFVERMWDPTVLIQGGIAVVWTPYDFHRNGEFSHCGIDAFNLLKTAEGWKIAGTIYTVEPTGCTPSPHGPLE